MENSKEEITWYQKYYDQGFKYNDLKGAYDRCFKKKTIDKEVGCWITHLKAPSKKDGYFQPSVKNKKIITLHVLSYAMAFGILPDEDGETCSHLCHNKACFNPDHLEIEKNVDNQRRKGCMGILLLNSKYYSVCKHFPKCVNLTKIPGVAQEMKFNHTFLKFENK